MIKRHVIYCDHCLDSVVEAGSNARERKPATVSHEFIFKEHEHTRKSNAEKLERERTVGAGISYLIQKSYEATVICGITKLH